MQLGSALDCISEYAPPEDLSHFAHDIPRDWIAEALNLTGVAIVQARDRLGESPMAALFIRSADQWAHQSAAQDRWRGLALYGVDGTTMRAPDSEENREHFGSQSAGSERGTSGYPLVRLASAGRKEPTLAHESQELAALACRRTAGEKR